MYVVICIDLNKTLFIYLFIYVLFTQKHITLNDIIVIFVDNYDFSLAFDLLQ